MSKWISAVQAASDLRSRGVDPLEALTAIVRESGEHGINKVWAVASRILVRGRSGSQWLTHPDIDIASGTIAVPSFAPGRRLPQIIDAPLLLVQNEIDRRWPPHADALRQKTNADQREEQQATDYFKRQILPGARMRKEDAFDLLRVHFPGLSDRYFKKHLWAENAPADWKKPGAPKRNQ